MAGLSIGSTVDLCGFIGGPFTGASMNPARTIGPAIVTGEFSHLWIFFSVPFPQQHWFMEESSVKRMRRATMHLVAANLLKSLIGE